MLLGHWKNFDELEENLTLEELMALLEAKRDREYDDKRFHAAMQGHKLPPPANSKFEEIKQRVRDRIQKQQGEAETMKALHIGFAED